MSEELAVNGGPMTWTKGFPQWPSFDRHVEAKVAEVLRSGRVNYWTGPEGMKFESAFARWLGVRDAISVSNGTAALHVALAALGVGPGDEVVCTSYSFVASSFCALHCGAMPVFCDVGADHLIDPRKIEKCITPRTKAIVVVHLYGVVADMDPIMRIARRRGLYVVEDCAQCLGGEYKGRKVGSIGDAGCFSFCQSKHITTGGEGGMVACRDAALAAEVRSLRDHGCDMRGKLDLLDGSERRLYYHRRVGYNLRMTEMQSAVGLVELSRFDSWNLPRRRSLGRALVDGLAGHPLVRHAPVDTPERRNAFWLAPFVLDVSRLKCTMGEFIAAVRAEGAGVHSVLWPEMYREEAFTERRGFGRANYPFGDPANRKIDYSKVECPVAHALSGSTISFWTHPTYTLAHMRADVRAFRKVAAATMRA